MKNLNPNPEIRIELKDNKMLFKVTNPERFFSNFNWSAFQAGEVIYAEEIFSEDKAFFKRYDTEKNVVEIYHEDPTAEELNIIVKNSDVYLSM